MPFPHMSTQCWFTETGIRSSFNLELAQKLSATSAAHNWPLAQISDSPSLPTYTYALHLMHLQNPGVDQNLLKNPRCI